MMIMETLRYDNITTIIMNILQIGLFSLTLIHSTIIVTIGETQDFLYSSVQDPHTPEMVQCVD